MPFFKTGCVVGERPLTAIGEVGGGGVSFKIRLEMGHVIVNGIGDD